MESFIDPITGGLSFVQKSNTSEQNAQKNANINDQYQPKMCKYINKSSTQLLTKA